MLDTYIIDGQRFDRVGTEPRDTSTGKTVTMTVWRSACPDCGMLFEQVHRYRGFQPARATTRRCKACRKGPGRPVRRSHASTGIAETRQPEPHYTQAGAADVTRYVSVEPRLALPVEPPRFYPRPRHPPSHKPAAGVFTDR